jgi:hypothetical protein
MQLRDKMISMASIIFGKKSMNAGRIGALQK